VDLRIGIGEARAVWEQTVERSRPADGERSLSLDEALAAIAAGCDSLGVTPRLARRSEPRQDELVLLEIPFETGKDGQSDAALEVHLAWDQSTKRVTAAEASWVNALLHTFAALLALGGESGVQSNERLTRPVRFVIGRDGADAPPADRDLIRDRTVIAVRVGPRPSVFVDGVLGDLARALVDRDVQKTGRGALVCRSSARWVRLDAAAPGAEVPLGALVAAVARWWATAQPDDVIALCVELGELLSQRIEEAVNEALKVSALSRTELFAHALEEALRGLWQMRPLLGEEEEAEAELEGWQREIEVAIRRRFDEMWDIFGSVRVSEARLPHVTAPAEVAWDRPYVVRAGLGGWSWRGTSELVHAYEWGAGRCGCLPRAPVELFDGERTLVEVAVRLAVEAPMAWERAAQLVRAWVLHDYLEPAQVPDYTLPDPELLRAQRSTGGGYDPVDLEEVGRSRTLLYFSYGSCMCRFSFRQTVPRYELIGAAELLDHRLGFTITSTRRGGGAADIVEEPGRSVWGILYRIPRRYLLRLDEREGVFLERYQRKIVAVKAFGTTLEPVLTYSVVNKAHDEVPPSPEYAGLIWDGAHGLLAAEYCRELMARLDEFQVEPVHPL